MNNVTWVFPTSPEELAAAVRDGARPHGGGTGLMRNIPRSGALADVARAGIGAVEVSGTTAHIGGAATYASAATVLGSKWPGNIITLALGEAASPALRNRITIGGSVALFPPWGRIVGPLVALDATLELDGAVTGAFPVADYVARHELSERSVIVAATVEMGAAWEAHWYRFSPVTFNYPLFSVVTLVRADGDTIADARIVVTGNRGRYARLEALEEMVRGKARAAAAVADRELGTDFPDRQGFSGDYLGHLAGVAISRALQGGPAS